MHVSNNLPDVISNSIASSSSLLGSFVSGSYKSAESLKLADMDSRILNREEFKKCLI